MINSENIDKLSSNHVPWQAFESSFLRANLQALRRHPHLYSIVEQSCKLQSQAVYRLEKAKNGLPTLVVETDGRQVTYHSRYDPALEARRLVDGIMRDGNVHVLALGYGLGYNLDYILDHLPSPGWERQVHVIEPDIHVFLRALISRDLQKVLSDSRIEWCVGMSPDEAGDRWASNLDWTALESVVVVEHQPSLVRFHDYFERIKEKIRYLSNRSKGNLVTLMYVGSDFHSNAFANLPETFSMPGIERLFDQFVGVPAVIVAAGPSLEKNVRLLGEVYDRFLIICVDTSFRQLVVRGIRPHIVLAADSSYLNSLDFVGVENETGVVLAVEPMTNPDIIAGFKGPKMMMSFGGGLLSLITQFREPTGVLMSWGSIATTAFDLAVKCGCDPIVFVGLDLSFQDGRLYARGSYSDDVFYDKVHHCTSLEHETIEYIQRRGVHRIEMPDGSVSFTDENMHIYRAWFEDRFRQTNRKIINATEGGVVTKYVECMTFKSVMENWKGSEVNPAVVLHDLMKAPVKFDADSLVAHLRGIALELGMQQDKLRRGNSLCRKLSRMASNVGADNLTGPALFMYRELLEIHDHILDSEEIYPWYATHQARFVTRHATELKRLKSDVSVPLSAWIDEIAAFFDSIKKFHDYQIPLISMTIEQLEKRYSIAGNFDKRGAI